MKYLYKHFIEIIYSKPLRLTICIMQICFPNVNDIFCVHWAVNWNGWNTFLWSARETLHFYVHWALNWTGENTLYMNAK